MSPEAETGGIIGTATALVTALWLALRASVAKNEARLESDLKAAREKSDRYEASALYWERKAHELAGEIKEAAKRLHSVPPRGELPTYDAILDIRQGDPVAADQRARQRAIDDELRAGIRDLPSFPPLDGVAPTVRRPKR